LGQFAVGALLAWSAAYPPRVGEACPPRPPQDSGRAGFPHRFSRERFVPLGSGGYSGRGPDDGVERVEGSPYEKHPRVRTFQPLRHIFTTWWRYSESPMVPSDEVVGIVTMITRRQPGCCSREGRSGWSGTHSVTRPAERAIDCWPSFAATTSCLPRRSHEVGEAEEVERLRPCSLAAPPDAAGGSR